MSSRFAESGKGSVGTNAVMSITESSNNTWRDRLWSRLMEMEHEFETASGTQPKETDKPERETERPVEPAPKTEPDKKIDDWDEVDRRYRRRYGPETETSGARGNHHGASMHRALCHGYRSPHDPNVYNRSLVTCHQNDN